MPPCLAYFQSCNLTFLCLFLVPQCRECIPSLVTKSYFMLFLWCFACMFPQHTDPLGSLLFLLFLPRQLTPSNFITRTPLPSDLHLEGTDRMTGRKTEWSGISSLAWSVLQRSRSSKTMASLEGTFSKELYLSPGLPQCPFLPFPFQAQCLSIIF